MPRAFNASAIARNVVAPLACICRTTGEQCGAREEVLSNPLL
jgi:hypothetical protein